jgi:WD40 repeat protein
VWDAASGAELAVLRGHEGPVERVRYSHDGARIVSCSNDKTLRIWDVEHKECLEVIKGYGEVAAIAGDNTHESMDMRAIASAGETIVESAADKRPVARFPEELWLLANSVTSRSWAGAIANHVYIVGLERETELEDNIRKSRNAAADLITDWHLHEAEQ